MSGKHVYFSFSTGLKTPLTVPTGMIQAIINHIAEVEEKLHIKRIKYLDYPEHWDTRYDFSHLTNDQLCDIVSEHNSWVKWLYRLFAQCSENPVKNSEELTPEIAKKFWLGLKIIDIPVEKWSRDYYVEHMERYYEVMRGRKDGEDEIILGCEPLSSGQANAVIWLFSHILDIHDCRLEVPNDCDFLAASDDGGYDWCEQCGPMLYENAVCCGKKGCPLRAEWEEQEE